MFESIYNAQVLQLGVNLNQLFHRESGKINWSLSLRHSLAAERGGAPAPAPAGLGGERGSAEKSRASIPACDSPVPCAPALPRQEGRDFGVPMLCVSAFSHSS